MRKNRPELQALRGKRDTSALDMWTEQFAGGDAERARAYLEAVNVFLGNPTSEQDWERYFGTVSPNTRKSYAFALNEFFEWLASRRGHAVAPNDATAIDAREYVQWLLNRTTGLHEEKLRDGDSAELHEIFKVVSKLGNPGIEEIARALPERLRDAHTVQRADNTKWFDVDWLHRTLGQMVMKNTMARTPSLSELRNLEVNGRRPNRDVGISSFDVTLVADGRETQVPMREVFTYSIPKAKPVSRTTVHARVAALSSFWDILMNARDRADRPLVTSNIWYMQSRRAMRGLRKEKKQASAKQRIDGRLVNCLLAAADHARTLPELRNRAILYLLVFAGVRVTELVMLRRGVPPAAEQNRWPGWFDAASEPPAIEVLRKGGVRMRLPYPPVALRPLMDYLAALDRAASAADGKQNTAPGGSDYLSPANSAWRYRELAAMPDAPLFPALWFWGKNTSPRGQALTPNALAKYTRSMTRSGVRELLQQLGRRAGFTQQELRQVHPHAFRHFALSAMARAGKNLREIQAIAGHDSITTTEQYLEDVTSPVALSGQAEVLSELSRYAEEEAGAAPAGQQAEQPPAERTTRPGPEPWTQVERPGTTPAPELTPPKPAPKPRRQVVETTGVRVPTSQQTVPTSQQTVPEVGTALAASERPAEPAVPDHHLPVSPKLDEPVVTVLDSGSGQVIQVAGTVVAVDGNDPPPGIGDARSVQLVNGKSAGDPAWVYEAMEGVEVALRTLYAARAQGDEPTAMEAVKQAEGVDAERISWSTPVEAAKGHSRKFVAFRTVKGRRAEEGLVQGDKWLAKHYDPWPENYGIGQSSLLPWYGSGPHNSFGYFPRGDRMFPPIPVLSPDQIAPETHHGSALIDGIERVYDYWLRGDEAAGIPPSPTRTFGLVRWFAFLSYISMQLSKVAPGTVDWRSWGHVCRLGSDLRVHRPEYVEQWLRQNAHTYTTTVHALKRVERGKSTRGTESTYLAVQMQRQAIVGMTRVAELPEWMAFDDPIKSLGPEEFDQFAKWIANVTGQRLTPERKAARDHQAQVGQEDLERQEKQLVSYLKFYFEAIDEISVERQARRPVSELAQEREQLALFAAEAKRLGAPDPTDPRFSEKKFPKRKDRIEAIVAEWRKEHASDATGDDPNLFAASSLFKKGAFRLERGMHTISHTPEYKQEFRTSYGQDSELVMRRAARAMWEKYKQYLAKDKSLTSSDYNYLFSIMLCYISWVVPSGADMERSMAAAGYEAAEPGAQRRAWLERQVKAVRALMFGTAVVEDEGVAEVDVLAAVREDYSMDDESLLAARSQELIGDMMAVGEQREDLPFRGLEDSIGVEGSGGGIRIFSSGRAGESTRRSSGKLTPNRVMRSGDQPLGRRRRLIANAGETTRTFYRLDFGPETEVDVYISPGVYSEGLSLTANARRVLPSPFAMIRALGLR